MPTVGAPFLRTELETDYATLALVLFVSPMVIGLVIESPLMVLVDRVDRSKRRYVIAAALAVMAASMLVCGAARSAWVFTLAYALYGPASGISCGLAQSALCDANPDDPERAMTRWTLAGAIGDLGAPLLIGACAAAFGWRWAFVAGGAMLLFWAVSMSLREDVASHEAVETEDEEEEGAAPGGFWASVREGFANRALVAWLVGSTLCSLMDETLLAFSVLRIRVLGGSDWDIAATGLALALGGTVSLALVERMLAAGRDPRAMLAVSCVGTVLSFIAWLLLPPGLLSIGAMFVAGAFIAPMYPITKARAFASAPGRGALVGALDNVFMTFDIAAPVLLGLVADRWGVTLALAVLLLQPVIVVVLAARWPRRLKR